jgi:hypothetical protein
MRDPTIQALPTGGAFQLSWFDECDITSITTPAFPGVPGCLSRLNSD